MKVYMILEILDFMLDLYEKFFIMSEYIFLNNILAQMEDKIPKNTIYQLKNWQYDLADIIFYYYKK